MLRTRAFLCQDGQQVLGNACSDEAVWCLPFEEILLQTAGTGSVGEDRELEGTWLLLSLIVYVRTNFQSHLPPFGEKGGQAVL